LPHFVDPALQTHWTEFSAKFEHNLAGVARKAPPAQLVIEPEHQVVGTI